MSNRNDIQEELKALNSVLAGMSRAMPYFVPEGYFETLDGEINARRMAMSKPDPMLLLPKSMPYHMPEGYFEDIAANIKALVQEPEPSIDRNLPHEVPAGYFEQLPELVLQKAKAASQKKSRVISLGAIISKNVRWAAAAIVLMGIGAGIYKYNSVSKTYNTQQALAGLSRDSINVYVQQNIDEYDLETITAALNPSDMKTATGKLTEEEIKNYLDETGWEESTTDL